jgi:hypothetical protein
MNKLLRRTWNAALNDEMAARRWLRILLVGFGIGGVGALPYAPERWRLWLFLAAGLAGCVGAGINLGDKNQPPPPGPTSSTGSGGPLPIVYGTQRVTGNVTPPAPSTPSQ